MYAIAFDFDTELLEKLYPNPSWRNAYADVRNYLEENGFEHRQGSVYFGDEDLTAAECIVIVQDMADEFNWFTASLKDIRMLRIEENNDLMVVLDRKTRRKKKTRNNGPILPPQKLPDHGRQVLAGAGWRQEPSGLPHLPLEPG